MDTNELIERYVHEVGQKLPRSSRADIEMELRSLLYDTIEERAADSGKAPNAKMTADMLRELGKPDAMAAQYRPEQSLIGPQLFPIYKQVLTIVLVIVSVVHVAGLVFMLLRGETAVFGQSAWNWFTGYFQTAVLNAGIVTLIFAAVDRAQIINWQKQSEPEPEWDPLSLPPVNDPDRINRFELGFGMLWTAAFLILFNFYPESVGIITFSGEETSVFPLLAAEFMVHVPWLTLVWTVELIVKSMVLIQGRWTVATRWLELAQVPLTIYVLNRIRIGGEIFTFAGITSLFKLGLSFVIVILVIDGLVKLVRLLTNRPLDLKARFA